MKINISYSVLIIESELFKYDQNNNYYNDLCHTYTSGKGTDISLKDRKKEFIENNMTLCEEDCEFNGYDNITKKVLCECPIKINLKMISEISINKNKLYNKFIDVKNFANLNMMKCYKILFTKDGIIHNIGNYIVICVIIIEFISIIIFYKKDLYIINKKIKEIILAKKSFKTIKTENNRNNKKNVINKIHKKIKRNPHKNNKNNSLNNNKQIKIEKNKKANKNFMQMNFNFINSSTLIEGKNKDKDKNIKIKTKAKAKIDNSNGPPKKKLKSKKKKKLFN